MNLRLIDLYAKQYEKFIESNENLMKMILTEEIEENWRENYHLINHDWIVSWKNRICFDNLDKIYYKKREHNKICSFLEKNINSLNINNLNLDNNSIYYIIPNKQLIDPMKSFDLISDDIWKMFDINNKNIKCNGKVSILKGNKKILIKYDENNYGVKYLASKNIFSEFIIVFNPIDNPFKGKILDDIKKIDIHQWMKEVDFQNKAQQFTINKYKIPFDIKQKSNNFLEQYNLLNISQEDSRNASKYVSFSQFSYSFALNSFDNISNFFFFFEISNFFNDIGNFRSIQKVKETSNICSVMRCLSMIKPLADYFMNIINGFKIFSKFQTFHLLNLVKEYFLNLWNDEKTKYKPEMFIYCLRNKKLIINSEQDPIHYLNFIIDYINHKFNSLDYDINLNINKNLFSKESYYQELLEILEQNNSIIGQNFLGLIEITCKCEKCNIIMKKIRKITILDIDFVTIINHFQDIDDSFIGKDIDFFLEYYFLKKIILICPNCNNKFERIKNTDEYEHCPKCDKIIYSPRLYKKCTKCGNYAKIMKKEILEFPLYLIIRLDLGSFDEKIGFKSIDLDSLSKIYINYYKISNLSEYCSNKNRRYTNINKYEYDLINMIKYQNVDNKISFLSICQSPFGLINQNSWISFECDKSPINVKTYLKEYSLPCILFYKLQEK